MWDSFLNQPRPALSAQRQMAHKGISTPQGFMDKTMTLTAPVVPSILRQWPAPVRIVTVSATDSDDAQDPSIHAGPSAIFQVTESLQST